MSYLFFVLHHRWRKNSSQWGIYRYQPSGNFEENQRGHRKKRDKKVVGKNFTGDEGLRSGLEQELMPDYPHHLHFHWNRRCSQLRIYLHTIRMLDLFQDRNGLLECDFGTLQFVITDHKFVLVLCTMSEKFLWSEMSSPPPASRRRNLTGVSARDPWTITRPNPPAPPTKKEKQNSGSYAMWEELECVLLPQKCGRENRCLDFANWLHAGCPMNLAAPP